MSIERKPLSEEAAIETQQKFAAIRSARGCAQLAKNLPTATIALDPPINLKFRGVLI